MKRFAEGGDGAEAERVYWTGCSTRLPKHAAHKAHWRLHLLTAATGWSDVGVISRVARWRNRPGRYGIHVDEKWFITFAWESPIGAVEIKLERRSATEHGPRR